MLHGYVEPKQNVCAILWPLPRLVLSTSVSLSIVDSSTQTL